MNILLTIAVTFFAGMGAGLGTGFAGMSAAAVISPMLITFLKMDSHYPLMYWQVQFQLIFTGKTRILISKME